MRRRPWYTAARLAQGQAWSETYPAHDLKGTPAVPALTHAAGRARPDKRRIYTDVLTRLTHR